MKRKISTIMSVLFTATITAGFLSTPAYSFWHGYEFPMDAVDDPEAVHDALVNDYLPGLASGLTIHDPVDDSELGQVTINKRGS